MGYNRAVLKGWKLFFLIVLLFLVLFFLVPVFYPESTFNCWMESFDINGGKYRYQRYIMTLKIMDSIQETVLSRDLVNKAQEDWKLVRIGMPFRDLKSTSAYAAVLNALNKIEEAYKTSSFSDEARQEVSFVFLKLIKDDEGDARVESYAQLILNVAYERKNIITTKGYLPSPPPR